MGKLKTNFIYDAAYQILILIIPFITTPYIARTIGPTGLGIYSYTYSIVNYFMMFALLGMNNYGNREVSKIKDNQDKLNSTFSSIYFLQLITTLFTSLIYLIYIMIADNQYLEISIIQMIYLISVAFDINWLFCGLQKFKITVTRSAFIKVLTLILIFVFVKGENDLWKYVLILASTTLLNQIVLWPFLRKTVKFVKVSFKEILKHLKPTLILFIPVIAVSIYRVMDKIMIGQICDVTQVGYYESAEKMLNIILTVVSALGTVTLPQMTYLYTNNNMEQYYKILNKSMKFIFFIVFPVIFGFLATADSLVLLYLGEDFMQSATILKILSISLLFSPIASIIRMQFLIPQNKDKEYIISVVLGACTNFILNIFLIKQYGAIGAAIATVIAEVVVAYLHYYFVRKEIDFKKYFLDIIKFAVKSCIMFIIVYYVGKLTENVIKQLIIQVAVGVVTYFTLNIRYINSEIDIKKIIMSKKGSKKHDSKCC